MKKDFEKITKIDYDKIRKKMDEADNKLILKKYEEKFKQQVDILKEQKKLFDIIIKSNPEAKKQYSKMKKKLPGPFHSPGGTPDAPGKRKELPFGSDFSKDLPIIECLPERDYHTSFRGWGLNWYHYKPAEIDENSWIAGGPGWASVPAIENINTDISQKNYLYFEWLSRLYKDGRYRSITDPYRFLVVNYTLEASGVWGTDATLVILLFNTKYLIIQGNYDNYISLGVAVRFLLSDNKAAWGDKSDERTFVYEVDSPFIFEAKKGDIYLEREELVIYTWSSEDGSVKVFIGPYFIQANTVSDILYNLEYLG